VKFMKLGRMAERAGAGRQKLCGGLAHDARHPQARKGQTRPSGKQKYRPEQGCRGWSCH